jgi:hypothetical protein
MCGSTEDNYICNQCGHLFTISMLFLEKLKSLFLKKYILHKLSE